MKTRLEMMPFDFRIDVFSDYPIRVFPRLNKDNGNSDFIDSKNSEICEKVIFVIQYSRGTIESASLESPGICIR